MYLVTDGVLELGVALHKRKVVFWSWVSWFGRVL